MVRLLYTLWNPAANLRRDPGNAKPQLGTFKTESRHEAAPTGIILFFILLPSVFSLQSSAFKNLLPTSFSSWWTISLGAIWDATGTPGTKPHT